MDADRIIKFLVENMHDERMHLHSRRHGEMRVCGNCEDPQYVHKASRLYGEARKWKKNAAKAPLAQIGFWTRCRKCRTCLKAHAREWASRAAVETDAFEQAHGRTWFGTLTLSPQSHFVVDTLCAAKLGERWGQSPDKRFAAQCAVIGGEATKFLKRIRKESGHRYRYLLVTEKHDSEKTSDVMSGRAHLHLLVHQFPNQELRKRMLERQWDLGVSHWRLVHGGRHAAYYVTKYVSKAIEARTRASIEYGNPPLFHE